MKNHRLNSSSPWSNRFQWFLLLVCITFSAGYTQTSDSISLPKRPESRPSILYLEGGEGAAWYHVGVLEAIEKFRIPIDTIIGSSWGAWIGGLWSAGWSAQQIAQFLQEPDVAPLLHPHFFEESPQSKNENVLQNFHLADPITGGFSGIEAQWKFRTALQGPPQFVPIHPFEDTLQQANTWFKFRVQESLWRENLGSRIPFQVLSCHQSPPSHELESQVLESLPLQGNAQSGELCTPAISLQHTTPVIRLASVPTPLRTSFTSSHVWSQQVNQQRKAYWDQASTQWITLRPHRLHPDSLSSPPAMRSAGFHALQSRLGELSSLANRLKTYTTPKAPPSQYRFQLVLDSIESVYHSHILSLWPQDTGLVAPRAYFESLARSGFYDSLDLNLGGDSYLQVQATGTPRLRTGVGAFGSKFHGLNAAGWAEMAWIDQFAYTIQLQGLYGQTVKGFHPSVHLGNLWSSQAEFLMLGDFTHLSVLHSGFYQEKNAFRLLKEQRKNITLGIDYRFSTFSQLRTTVQMEKTQYSTGTRNQLNESNPLSRWIDLIEVNGLHFNAIYSDSTPHYQKWFSRTGHLLKLSSGFRSVGVNVFGQSSAPLYLSSQGEWESSVALTRYTAVAFGAEGGLNMRRGAGGRVLYPDALEIIPDQVSDPALDNRYRLRMGLTPWQQEWWTTQNTSHHYALARITTSLQHSGTGLFLMGGYIRDFESNPWSPYSQDRLFMEPILRFQHHSLDLRLGMNRQVNLTDWNLLRQFKDYQYYLQLGAFAF